MPSSRTQPTVTFRDAALRSGLIDESQYRQAAERCGTEAPDELSRQLVTSGLLTEYQAQQLREGRTKLTLGPYLITEFIGQGGMGQVFKGVHKVMKRECAVKVLPREKSTAESRAVFDREICMQAGLDCRYLVRAYDAGQDGSVNYLVTEYVPGNDLRRLIRNQGALPMEQAANIISQAAMGLQYAHDLGIVHRDVKPGNILVTPEGHAKLSDVGLAAWSMGLDDDPRAGRIVGTADYLSPEQIRSPRDVGPLSDIYSLGCTLYYVATGKVPFPGGDSRSKCRRHLEQAPWHPRRIVPELSEDFVDVIADMMEKDPARRISSAAEVAERLEPWSQVAVEVVDRPLDRQSWASPPPPKEPNGLRESAESSNSPNSDALSNSGGDSSSVPPVPATGMLSEASQPELQIRARPRHGLAIAIALSIAVPISLLIGAVIGFLVRQHL